MATGMGIGAILPLGFYDPLVSRQVIVRHSRHIDHCGREVVIAQSYDPLRKLPAERCHIFSVMLLLKFCRSSRTCRRI